MWTVPGRRSSAETGNRQPLDKSPLLFVLAANFGHATCELVEASLAAREISQIAQERDRLLVARRIAESDHRVHLPPGSFASRGQDLQTACLLLSELPRLAPPLRCGLLLLAAAPTRAAAPGTLA